MTTTQENRPFAVDTPLGPDVLLLAGLHGTEAISRLFRFELRLISESHAVPFEEIIGQDVTVSIDLADGGRRFLHGMISRFSQGSGGGDETVEMRYAFYTATLVPRLWLLTQTTDCRIFQNQAVPEIVQTLLREHSLDDVSLRLSGSYEPREYTVQYRETDFNFVSRLLEEEGIFFFFEHEEDKHTLVLADGPGEHKPCPGQEEALYQRSGGGQLTADVLARLNVVKEIRAGKCTLCDFNFEAPKTDLSVSVDAVERLGPGDRELYDYPGAYTRRNAGDRLTTIRMEAEECRITTLRGASACRAFASGFRFTLKEHYREDFNDKAYVLTEVVHDLDQSALFPGVYGEARTGEPEYANQFECIPHEVPFRPPRVTPRPVMDGVQTAIVVGPQGEEIYTDEYGRVKVRFHWDRVGDPGGDCTCWIRVSQAMAGNQWGAVAIPRIGHEVIVDFIEGDPDRPIILGQVYHGVNRPPYELPAEKTRTAFKTNSSKGGGGFNEIRFEDRKGGEQVFIHAERRQDIRTKGDRLEWVGNDSHLIIRRHQLEKVTENKHLTVGMNLKEKIEGDKHLQASNLEEKVVFDHALDAGFDIHLKAGFNVVIEGTFHVSLKAGGSFVDVTPAGVYIQGPMVMINSGGSPRDGVGSSPMDPDPPQAADTGDPGAISEADPGAGPASPPPAGASTPQARAFQAAAESGTPFVCP